MPIETAQYIDTLQPDWPDGKDPESGGDDHIRMVKQVLQNQFPGLNAPVIGTPTQLNNLTGGIAFAEEDAANNRPAMWEMYQPQSGDLAAVYSEVATKDQLNATRNLVVTWANIQDLIYPVHTVIMTDDNTNPANRLGFGTWEAISGAIYGAGTVADNAGMNASFTPGKIGGSYRVQESHIVAMTKTLDMDAVDDHTHSETHVAPSSTPTVYARTDALSSYYATAQTGPAGGHTPSGTVAIGDGSATSGTQFLTPGYVVYFWRRTA